ncbi:methylglutaconyl-CoA hydratase [Chitinivorax tropicus]|uniref:Methylglutaconyl-CoA hydratase n=1 Tax=Chitinivorax tropicus TaxID=714531 RepID=A0A840MM47_9PROT|nr:enoyl-CoA hydratase/isomerase family protein [Chitinivorax tropicus]MBB5018555.1 methylglutaconyl-CoA hydratase [Chitinivorax tropicus]
MTDSVLLSIDDRGVARLHLNRAELHNAFDDSLIRDLTHHLQQLQSNPAVRVLVLSAEGKSFSAGADLNWMKRMAGYSEAQNLADAMDLAGLMHILHTLRIPTIARVQGAAFGGGVGLLACCDLVVASEAASFCLSEVKLGLIPAVISPYVVGKLGASQARRYFLTAERFDAATAHRLGLVHEVTTADHLDEQVNSWIKLLLANGPHAMAAAKQLIDRVSHSAIDDALIHDTAQRIAHIRASQEGKEGLNAFLEKRPPAWIRL